MRLASPLRSASSCLQSYNSYLAGSAKAGAIVSLTLAQPDSARPAASSANSAPTPRSGEENEAAMPDE
nr:hypothetical protein BDOA9_0154600 [Bradyrhizobium sp. DOA9]